MLGLVLHTVRHVMIFFYYLHILKNLLVITRRKTEDHHQSDFQALIFFKFIFLFISVPRNYS